MNEPKSNLDEILSCRFERAQGSDGESELLHVFRLRVPCAHQSTTAGSNERIEVPAIGSQLIDHGLWQLHKH